MQFHGSIIIYTTSLLQLFMKFGLPRVITSDQGGEFNNKLDNVLMAMLNIDHRLTTVGKWTNGLVERYNQTLQKHSANLFQKKTSPGKITWTHLYLLIILQSMNLRNTLHLR